LNCSSARLFYNEYLNHLGNFGWREQHNIVVRNRMPKTLKSSGIIKIPGVDSGKFKSVNIGFRFFDAL